MADTGDWKGIQIKNIVPELDPLDASSLFSKVKQQANGVWDEIDQRKTALDSLKQEVDDLYNKTRAAKDTLDGLFNYEDDGSLSNTDIDILNTEVKYNIIKGIGITNDSNEGILDVFEQSLSDTQRSDDPETPNISETTHVGMITIMATGSTSAEIESEINKIKNILKGLN